MDFREKSRNHAQRRREQARAAARERLQMGQFIRRLLEIADKVETAEPQQVAALRLKADIYHKLLGKIMPDLKATELTATLTHRQAENLTDEELLAIAATGRADTTEAESGENVTH